MIRVRGHNLNVDIESELQKYNWRHARWKPNKLIACSPFRFERKPSFACSLETGVWIDSGNEDDPEWFKGNFIKLLSYLQGVTYVQAEEYLLRNYSPEYSDLDELELKINLQSGQETSRIFFQPEDLEPYQYKHPYLTRRGISEKVQRAVKIGYDPKTKAVVIPWFDRFGRIVNIKFRSVKNKVFWYAADGQPIENHLYLLDLVYRLDRDPVYIVEGEIDALTLWQTGRAAVALGQGSLTRNQTKLLIKCPAKMLIIATDNDKAGQRIKQEIIYRLAGFKYIKELVFPPGRKDVNEFTEEELKNLASRPVNLANFLVDVST